MAGKLTFQGREFDQWMGVWLWVYRGDLAVRCHGLTPNTTYTVCWDSLYASGEGPIATDAFGEGATVGQIIVSALSKNGRGAVSVGVYRADGTLVLSGDVSF